MHIVAFLDEIKREAKADTIDSQLLGVVLHLVMVPHDDGPPQPAQGLPDSGGQALVQPVVQQNDLSPGATETGPHQNCRHKKTFCLIVISFKDID